MTNILVPIHALAGILAIFFFLFLFVELLRPDPSIKKAKLFTLLGTILIFFSFATGGYYYVSQYGTLVKPLIKKGTTPWVHSIIMETKEHLFLFLPYLTILLSGIIFKYSDDLSKNHKAKSSVLALCALIILVTLSIAGMGYLISTAARVALGG